MAGVSSVEFRLERGGAPIFIDELKRIALDSLRGQFSVPGKAQAELEVTVNDNMATRLGAIAVDDEVWISNPVTGDFETLPAGYDIDPSKFFDPKGGWQPLLANLRDVRFVGVDDRGGERYHITGTAPAAQVSDITVGLVKGQDVTVDMWIHPDTYLVTAAEFQTVVDGGTSDWKLELDHYGESFTIEPPANVRELPSQTDGASSND
jgi:lipoprotein LprG